MQDALGPKPDDPGPRPEMPARPQLKNAGLLSGLEPSPEEIAEYERKLRAYDHAMENWEPKYRAHREYWEAFIERIDAQENRGRDTAFEWLTEKNDAGGE